jgi:hypothetical protein
MISPASRPRTALARAATLAFVGSLVVACASAGRKESGASAKSPSTTETAPADAKTGPGAAGGVPGQPQYAPPPPPIAPGTAGGTNPDRAIAIGKAGQELDNGQRELDVAAGDCRNACRALGSMDRAAGKLCELVAGSNDAPRCDDAKRRLYSARDKVRETCQRCPDGPSVDRNAPIPSVR